MNDEHCCSCRFCHLPLNNNKNQKSIFGLDALHVRENQSLNRTNFFLKTTKQFEEVHLNKINCMKTTVYVH